MSKDETAIEAEIQNKGLTAKRITPDMLDAEIASEDFHAVHVHRNTQSRIHFGRRRSKLIEGRII